MRAIAEKARRASARAAREATRRSALPFWIAGATAAGILIVFLVAGGLAAAERVPTAVDAGSEVRTSLYSVTVIDAELTDEVAEEFLEADPGETLLVMTVEIENLSDRPIGVGTAANRVESKLVNSRTPLLDVPEVADSFSTRAWRTDASAGGVVLQPGVPSELHIAWSVPDDAFPDGIAELNVFDANAQGGQIILSSSVISWQRSDQVARVTVDLGEGS